jgi:hypothetical protein
MKGVPRVLFVCALLSGCVPYAYATGEALTRRASFDLNCDASGLYYRRIDDRTQGVRGCGKRATYVAECNGPRRAPDTTCSWILNGGVEGE